MNKTLLQNTKFILAVGIIVGLSTGMISGYFLFTPSDDAERDVVEIEMEAFQWGFDPDYIEVNKGDHVKLIITATADEESQYSKHSIILNEFGISEILTVGETTTVEFDADKVGEFTFQCGLYCGTDHLDMKGTFVVKESGATTETGQEEIEELSPTTELNVEQGDWNNEDLMVIVQREDRSIAIVDGSTHSVIGTINGLGYQPHTIVFSSTMDYGYLIGRGGWLNKINFDTLQVEGSVKVGESSRGTAITQDDKYVLVSNYEPASFLIVNTDTMKIEIEYQIPVKYNQSSGEPLQARVASIVDAPNNRMFVALKDLGEVWVVNMNETSFPIEKRFTEVGGLLHDAFITKDGRYYMLASQADDMVFVVDTVTLDEVAKITTEDKPHPGPGALWGKYAFSPSVGLGALNIWDMENFEFVKSIEVGGPGLFARSYLENDSYPYIWWDTILSTDPEENKMIHILDARTINDTNPDVTTIKPGPNSLKPEFTYHGDFVYISSWQEDGFIKVYNAYTFEEVTTIAGLVTPTGIFNLGIRAHEYGL